MSDATTPQPDGTNVSTVTTLEQLAAIVAALAGSVQTLTSQAGATQTFQTQIADGLKNLSEHVDKISSTVSEVNNANFQTTNQGVYDPYDDLRRANIARDRVSAYAEQALANSVEFMKMWTVRSLDHFGALPPVAPRSAAGPTSNGN